jgi:hypothetical protein
METIKNLETGDLILFNAINTGWFSIIDSILRWATHSNYTHVGMVLKNPNLLDKKLDGLYVWESGWENKPDPIDNIKKFGVQITPLKDILSNYKKSGHCYIRKLNDKDRKITSEKLYNIYKDTHQKPYDLVPFDWMYAFFQADPSPQKKNRFWCSAIIGYIYTKCGILDPDTDWSILRPSDFSLSGENLKYIGDSKLENKEIKIF